jgi:hypothetical protein
MTTAQILLGLLIGLAGNECSDVSRWLARKLIRWSAHRHYAPPARAELRSEELTAYIDDCPGNLFKLITALGFAAVAVLTRKIAPSAAPPNPLWRPTTPTVLVHYEDGGMAGNLDNVRGHPNVRAVEQALLQLTDEVRCAAKEVGVGSRSWRRCLRELQRITKDDRWTMVARNLDILKEISYSSWKIEGFLPRLILHWSNTISVERYHYSVLADSTIAHYQAAVETARAEIRRLTSDFLLSSALP